MFSRKERDYLQHLAGQRLPSLPSTGATGDAAGARAPAQGEFPVSPGYLRKLQWGIRQKVAAVADDWELYGRALQREPRLRPLRVGASAVDPSLPIHTDLLVVLGRRLRGRGASPGPGTDRAPPSRTKKQ